MKRILLILLVGLLSQGFCCDMQAKAKKNKGKTPMAQSTAKTVKRDDPYAKIFKDKKKHTVKRGLMNVHLYDGKVYLEIPSRLLGHDFIVSTVITNSSDISLIGMKGSASRCIEIDKTDSLVLFRDPKYNIRLNENDSIQKEAFALSRNNAIYKSFPIAGHNADSTAVLFNATSFFACSNKDILNLVGRSYGGMEKIASATIDSKNSFTEGVAAYESGVCVTQDCTAKLGISIMGLSVAEQPEVTITMDCTMALLPEWPMKTREANPKVASGYVAYTDYRDAKRVKRGYYATRRNLIHKYTLYIDTLMQDSWAGAVRKSVDGWNNVFNDLGLGRPISLEPYPNDSTFKADDPMLSTISFMNNNSSAVTAYNITDPRTGEILSTKIGIPRNVAYAIRRNGVYKMAEVDSRFRTYYLPDDVICEYLTAQVLRAVGRSLGLQINLAGSAAYSPEQLRSADFTAKYGITASVMDQVTYNFLARPGDKEKGVKLVVDKPGVGDKFVVKYLYDRTGPDETATLKQWVDDRDGNPCYFYGKNSVAYASDPRCKENDLGNDPIAAIDAQVAHVKYIVANSAEWFHDDGIPEEYRSLFPDFTVIELINKTLTSASSFIGGIYVDEAGRKDDRVSYKSVPSDLQRKVARKILDTFYDLGWLDSNPDFMRLGGANASISTWIYNSGFPMRSLMSRLRYMGLSVDKSDNPYTQDEYLTDIERRLFRETISGKPLSSFMIPQINNYIELLKQINPTLKALDKATSNSSALALAETDSFMPISDTQTKGFIDLDVDEQAGMEPMTSIDYYTGTDIETVCYDKLKSARNYLKRARSLARDEVERGKCDYLIMLIDRVL